MTRGWDSRAEKSDTRPALSIVWLTSRQKAEHRGSCWSGQWSKKDADVSENFRFGGVLCWGTSRGAATVGQVDEKGGGGHLLICRSVEGGILTAFRFTGEVLN